ncbi:DNA mismatch endonuclease Vsr [Cereibacter johrii]|uniref:very short patch repair endonuclease n=1 Tax=Cereibacter johrii TaxID=445629 RepID=UPI002B261A74|nr:DNA mismatch endonuclease Vsr [Cereibacter johrii]MEA5162468.1 DNA mismatch endonuclease Vsr [Cereibacter johrii]
MLQTEGAKEGAKSKGPMSRLLLLDRYAYVERGMFIQVERGKSLAEAARACEQIDDAESGWQFLVLSDSVDGCILVPWAETRRQMTDIVDSRTRSRMMSGIRGKNTKPELVLRRSLHAAGYRFRLHAKGVPGKPDIVMPKYRAVILVHGCFWHRHEGCRYSTLPSTRPEFWMAKFKANVARDEVVRAAVLEAGWRVATVWECALRTGAGVAATRERIEAWLHGTGAELHLGEADHVATAR